ncbi:MAG: biotin/lipoyl-containing protein, partial [Eubacterium sp.]
MAKKVIMPKLGLTMTEGVIHSWFVDEGEEVAKGDVIFEVGTEKLTNEIEAKLDGVVLKILVPEGETVPCQTVVAIIGEAG